ncbi:Ribosome-recycling factor, mitochondrial [Trichoplax sp. H2]|uniref:Ribosome-recycling factor, mitochondrial n=1 Tax=Trichoplax adhaerens TaxID=10228 RepID=B3RVM8_TRIAD|nr:hypothetical protein TRIADDRAFT_55709 [Trichoplax adhaerens]EDV25527.1 hypothetical protein TRIADDRAFT_55709 [Trichoplax adhaerens]RDD47002.1 Ribosome-recycling factor, mitochondrial [Trichoplax sp. H2]|eukprot:XP_002111560.1 hypothetical protein TRIADDRAFT_55709 [Trichoplax adhaerens]
MAVALNSKLRFCSFLIRALPIRRNDFVNRQINFNQSYYPMQQWLRYYAKKSKKQEKKLSQLAFDDDMISFSEMKIKLEGIVDGLAREYSNILVSRITPENLNRISVQTNDGKVPLKQLGQVTSTSPQLLHISLAAFPEVVNNAAIAIRNAGLNLNPIVDGPSLKVPIPKMTKEQREKIVKTAKSSCDKAKVNIRRVRQNYMNDLKKLKGVSEDDVYDTKDKIQAMTDNYSNKLDSLFTTKSDDVLRK